MDMRATASFTVGKWDEQAYYTSPDGGKMTRAEVSYSYHGDVEGEGIAQYLMTYRPDATGIALAFERITGSVGGRSGSFVIQHDDTFRIDGVTGTYRVVPGMGTEELRGLRGEGVLSVAGPGPYSFVLDYRFE